jgi:hypothetical protein
MPDAHEAKLELGQWFMKMLEKIDEDDVTDPAVIANLHKRLEETFTEWRTAHGLGMQGPST